MRYVLGLSLLLWATSLWAEAPAEFQKIDAAIEKAIAAKNTPGAVLAVLHRGEVIYRKAYGKRTYDHSEAMSFDTIFDMASITKPVATASSIWKLIESGKLSLNDKVAKHWPEFGNKNKEKITIEHLLLHTSGLTADNALDDYKGGKKEALQKIAQLPLEAEPGTRFRYSDVGFIVLGELVERLSGQALNQFASQQIFQPLGLNDTHFLLPDSKKARWAPTKIVSRETLIGTVHDPRSLAMGGVAGHAGLFGTLDDLTQLARMLLNEGELNGKRIFTPTTVRLMTAPVPVSAGWRSRGWDVDTPFSAQRGDRLDRLTGYGHTGFTGTSIWMDPPTQTAIILLTNRVYGNDKANVTPLRREVATIVASALLKSEKQAETTVNLTSTGIDVLVRDRFKQLKGKKVGLVTNHTGKDRQGRATIDLLHKAEGVQLIALFSPEHGIRGLLDEKVSDSKDEKTGLPIYSLYGKTNKPTKEQLQGIDTLVYDIQDIGCRFYTYISTLGHVMEAAKEQNLAVIVLDRPNPIGGVEVEGPITDTGKESFIAYHAIPIRHGMTVGELANMFNQERKLNIDLTVIRLEGWKRSQLYDQSALTWINPSPNMRSLTAALLYPGIGLLETTNLSVGRGTERPFEWIGAPWIDGVALARSLNRLHLPGLRFLPVNLTPSSHVFKDQLCGGVQIIVDDWTKLKPVRSGLQIARELHALYPESWQIKNYNRLLVHQKTWEAIRDLKSVADIETAWKDDLIKFQDRRKTFLLYQD